MQPSTADFRSATVYVSASLALISLRRLASSLAMFVRPVLSRQYSKTSFSGSAFLLDLEAEAEAEREPLLFAFLRFTGVTGFLLSLCFSTLFRVISRFLSLLAISRYFV